MNKKHPVVTLNDTLLTWTMNSFAQSLTIWVGAFALQWVHPKLVIAAGCGLALIGIFSSSFVTKPLPFAFLFGLTYGIGIGIAYLTPVICAWEYFPNRKGLVSALTLGGFGFGSFVFGYISLAIANPENEAPELEVSGGKIFYPDMEQSDRAPLLIRINTSIWACLTLIAILLVSRPQKPKDFEDQHISLEENAKNNQISNVSNIKSVIIEKEYIDIKQALKTPATWNLCSIVVISAIQAFYISQIYKSFGEVHIPDDAFMTTVGTVANILNFSGRIFWPIMQDRFKFKPLFFIILVTQISIGLTLNLVRSSKVLYFIWINTQYFCLSGYFSLTPTV